MNITAIITGASKGIGKALAEKLLQADYAVIGTSRSGVIKTVNHSNFFQLPLDLSKQGSIEQAHKIIQSRFETIDLLLNNAGIGPDLYSDLPSTNTFAQTFQVNVEGTVFFTEPLIEKMSKNGILLNISSKMGSLNECKLTDSIAYRMSKSALNMYTKILTNRLKNKVRVAAIHPGWVKTTIAPDNLEKARLSPAISANRIVQFLESDFATGTFWDAEREMKLDW